MTISLYKQYSDSIFEEFKKNLLLQFNLILKYDGRQSIEADFVTLPVLLFLYFIAAGVP